MTTRRLRISDAQAFRRIRLQGLKESPTLFGSSYSDEVSRPLSSFKDRLQPNRYNWVFGAFEDRMLIGVVRLIRKQGMKERHKAAIYGMYVTPSSRRRGVARGLLEVALIKAKKLKGLRMVQLTVVSSNVPALSLYKDEGFVEYGREEDALFVSGKFHSELLMVKRL